jgi:hypothetical protein
MGGESRRWERGVGRKKRDFSRKGRKGAENEYEKNQGMEGRLGAEEAKAQRGREKHINDWCYDV